MFPRGYFPTTPDDYGTAYEWPEPDPYGPLMMPLAKLATLLAVVPAFQIRCGLSGEDGLGVEKLLDGDYGATKRIFYPVADPREVMVFPSAELYIGDEFEYSQWAGGEHNYLLPSGAVDMILVDRDRHPQDLERSTRDFLTYVGTLLREMKDQAARNDELAITSIRQKQKPLLCPVAEEASQGWAYWHAVYSVMWGSRG